MERLPQYRSERVIRRACGGKMPRVGGKRNDRSEKNRQ